jgi:hypothetical protein
VGGTAEVLLKLSGSGDTSRCAILPTSSEDIPNPSWVVGAASRLAKVDDRFNDSTANRGECMKPIVIRVRPDQMSQTYADFLRASGRATPGHLVAEQLSSLYAEIGHGFTIVPHYFVKGMPAVHWGEGTAQSRGSVGCQVAWLAPHAPIRIVRDTLHFGDGRQPEPGGTFLICLAGASAQEIEAASEPSVDRMTCD